MGQSPFAKHAAADDLGGLGRRRSARVDYACLIIISGRDAAGQPFREVTETSIVNLHGCKLRTRHQVLVGMMVSIECPATQASAKGVCVRVLDAQPGETAHDIAVQLVKPQNIWGLKNPPPDWEAVAQELVKGKAVPAKRARVVPEPAAPPLPAGPSPEPPLSPLLGGEGTEGWPIERAFGPPASRPDTEMQSAVLEQRAAQLTESVLQILRSQADEVVRDTVDTFRQQLAALVKEAEEQIQKRAVKTYEDVEVALTTLRGDLAEQFSERTEQIAANAQEALLAKVREMFANMLRPSPKK